MYVGVDTQKQMHVLVTIAEDGRTQGSRTAANTPEGWLGAILAGWHIRE